MAGGTWSYSEKKERAGLYINFKAAAAAQIQGGSRGIVAMPIKADWGPLNEFVTITTEKELYDTFGTGGTVKLAKRALVAGKDYKPSKLLLYRIAGTSVKKASVNNGTVLKIEAKYHGTDGNKINYSVADNIIDGTKKDFKIFNGNVLLKTYTVTPTDIAGLASIVNADTDSLVTLTKLADGTLTDVANQYLSSGDSGLTVTSQDYINAMTAFEVRAFNVFCLDGIVDSAIITSTRDWIKRLRNEGKKVQLTIGGSSADDNDVVQGNTRSRACDHEGIINVIVGTKVRDEVYTSAETACQVAGLIAGTPINKSTTYKVLDDVDDVTKRLTNEEIKLAIKSGSFVLVADTDPETEVTVVKVERGINTLTTYTEEKNEKFSKIRVIRTLDAISDDLTKTASKSYIGELDNNDDGRAALLSAYKLYLEQLANDNAISKDFINEVDKYVVSDGDKVYLNTEIAAIDSIEQIFNNITVK